MPEVVFKHPDDVIDVSVDYSDWLGSDTISTSTWTVPSGITEDSESETTTVATVWLSGGSDGTSYTLTNQIVTAGGRTKNTQVIVNVEISTVISTAYADNEDVEAMIVISYTRPTSGEVDAWCVQYSARIDAILEKNGYGTIPATGSNDVAMLKGVVTMGVAALTWTVAFGEDSPQSIAWREAWTSFIDDLKESDVRLQDQSPAATLKINVPAVYGYND